MIVYFQVPYFIGLKHTKAFLLLIIEYRSFFIA